MATIPVGYAEVTFRLHRIGAIRDSTWALGVNWAGAGVRTAQEIADDWDGFATAAGRPYAAGNMLDSWQYLGTSVTLMDDTGPLIAKHDHVITGTLTSPAVAMAPNCAILLRKRTALGGRRNRGRAYIPPVFPSEGSVDAAGVIAGASLTAIQGFYDSMFTGSLLNYDRVLFHNEAPFTPTPINLLQFDGLIATQRRRLRR